MGPARIDFHGHPSLTQLLTHESFVDACLNIYQACPAPIRGRTIADAVAIIGGLNLIAGDLDR